MKPSRFFGLSLIAMFLFAVSPTAAQRHPGGGPPSGRGPGDSRGASGAPGLKSETGSSAMSHQTPSDVLSHHPRLAQKLQILLGAKDMQALNAAAAGFKNFGQFVAAVHVSKNLGIPFDQLKAKMTGDKAESLGKAIHDLKPDADIKAEVKKANKQTKDDMDESASETGSGT